MICISHSSVAIAMGKQPLHVAEKPSQTQKISFHRMRIKKTMSQHQAVIEKLNSNWRGVGDLN